MDLLGHVGANGHDLHSEIILFWETSIGEDAEPLGPFRVDNMIAGENTVDASSVVEE